MNHALFKNLILYIASGTGNTYRLGCWIREEAENAFDTNQLVMIDDPRAYQDMSAIPHLLVGVLFPTHGFMPPWSMIKFLFKMPRGNGAEAFCAATRGGLKIGPLRIPGIAGFAAFLAAVIMLKKGYRIRGIFSLDMPSNFINFHWGLHPKNVSAIAANARQKSKKLFLKILGGQRLFFTLNNAWEFLWSILMFWFIPVLPILYLLFGKLFMAKLMFYNRSCNGCGICEKFCPNHGILMKPAGGQKRPFWTLHCETCLRCMGYCPQKAIEAGHSWAVILFYITSVPILGGLFLLLSDRFNILWPVQNTAVQELLELLFFFPVLFISYRIFWNLNRIGIINRIFSLTTLTHYYRRYHDPETKIKQLAPHLKSTHGEKK